MKKIIFLMLLLAAAACPRAEERNMLQNLLRKTSLTEVLSADLGWVPYPAYSDRAGWEELTAPVRDVLIKRGERALGYEWQVVRATDYLEYERSGNRRIMEDRNTGNIQSLADLVLAELAEGRGRFIDQIVNGAFHMCEMTSWALSAHTPLQHSRRSLPEKDDHVIALVSCGVGSLLAWTDYFFSEQFDCIDPSISRRIRSEVRTRIMDTFMNEDRFWWMGFGNVGSHTINNWTPWCNCNVLQCFMLLEHDPARLAAAVERTMRSVDQFFNYISGDGACEEGPAYWEAAGGKAYEYLQVLWWATGGRISLFDEPMIRDMGEYISRSYVGDGWVVNFADATARGVTQAPLVYRYGKAVGSSEMMAFAASMVRERPAAAMPAGRDMLRVLETIRCCAELQSAEAALPSHAFTWYPETQFCYMRSPGGLFLAAKGGHNNESHNHNDVGTFTLYADNRPVLLDAGVGTYTRQTFGSERYSIWTMRSEYHNLPQINGFGQHNGAEYRAADVRVDARRRSFSADISGAYPAEAGIEQWVRSYRLGSREAVITDDFRLWQPSQANVLHFMSRGTVDVSSPGVVVITLPGEERPSARLLYDASQFEASVESIALTDPRLTNVWGGQIERIGLRARKLQPRGRYTVRVEVLN